MAEPIRGRPVLGLERRHDDGPAVVGVEELPPFVLGLGELAGEQLAVSGVGCLALFDLGQSRTI